MGSPARTTLLWILLLLPAGGAALAVEPSPEELLARAEQAFAQRRFQDVLSDLQHLPASHELAPRARFLRAYAHYQLGELPLADELLASLEDSAEVGLLRGMVAYGQGAFDKALERLEQVVAAGQPPWSAAAEKLIGRVRADADRARNHRIATLMKRVEADLQSRRFDAARRRLDEADKLKPQQLMSSYYRGYMAYKRMRYKRAVQHLQQALAINPTDGWSIYMLALTRAESGDLPAARRALIRLRAESKDLPLRRRAREALELLESPGEQRRTGLTVFAELGSGLDTNPAYINEVPAGADEASWELHAAARVSYQHWFTHSLKVVVGAGVFERAYAKGGERFEQTELTGWGTTSLVRERYNAALSYSYVLFMYGHSPLSSAHGGHLSFNYALRSWLWLVTAGRVVGRPVHDVAYSYLPWLDMGGATGVRLVRGWLTTELSYDLSRSWANAVVKDIKINGSGKGKVNTTTRDRVTSDYTQLGHGPYLWARARLPWRLHILAGMGLTHRRFDNQTSVNRTSSSATQQTVYGPREDLMLTAQAELARRFAAGFEVALRFESVANFSNLTVDEWGQDRSYNRQLAGAAVRWTWPPP